MHTSSIEELEDGNPFHGEEIQALIDQLGECIIDEVLFRVNQELGKLDTGQAEEGRFDPAAILGVKVAAPPEKYSLQDKARYDDSIPKTLLHVTEVKKVNDSTTNVEEVFGPSPWGEKHESGKGVLTGNRESSTAKLIFEAAPERVVTDESRELFLLKELLRTKNEPIVFKPAPKRKKKTATEESTVEKKRYSSPNEFNLDPVQQIRLKSGKSVNR